MPAGVSRPLWPLDTGAQGSSQRNVYYDPLLAQRNDGDDRLARLTRLEDLDGARAPAARGARMIRDQHGQTRNGKAREAQPRRHPGVHEARHHPRNIREIARLSRQVESSNPRARQVRHASAIAIIQSIPNPINCHSGASAPNGDHRDRDDRHREQVGAHTAGRGCGENGTRIGRGRSRPLP